MLPQLTQYAQQTFTILYISHAYVQKDAAADGWHRTYYFSMAW